MTLDRLLRPQSVDRAVAVLRIAALIGCAILVLLGVRRTIEGWLLNRTALLALQSEVALRVAAVPDVQVVQRSEVDYRRLSEEAIFGTIGGRAAAAATPPPTRARSSLTLIGTFVTEGESPYAIIDNKKTQDVFGVGDPLFDEGTVRAIFSDRVEIQRDGRTEVLTLDENPEGSAAEAGGDAIVVDEQELDRALENLPLLLTQARAVPYFKDGQSVGLRLFAIKSGSLFEKIGLMNGDILKAVNGNSLGDITQAVKLFEKLKEQRSITVNLERQREEKALTYQIR